MVNKQERERESFITIGIPLYNMENSICNAIESALKQTYKNTEILIVDDKSTDNGVKVVEEKYKKEIKEGKIRIYKRKKNGGCSLARRDLIDNAKGEYICFFDADDISYPDRVEKQYNAIKEAEKEHKNQMVGCFCGAKVNNLYTNCNFQIDPNDLFLHFAGGCGVAMYKVADIKKLGNFDKTLKRGEDTDMCIRMLKNNAYFEMISEPLLTYNYTHNATKSISKAKEKLNPVKMLKKIINKLITNKQKFKSTGNLYLDRYYQIFHKTAQIKVLYVPLLVQYDICGCKTNSQSYYYLFNLFPIFSIRVKYIFYKNKHYTQYRLFGIIPIYTKLYYGIEQ